MKIDMNSSRAWLGAKAVPALAFAGLLGGGCDPSLSVPLVFNEAIENAQPVRVMWFSEESPEPLPAPAELDMAADILGLEVVEVDEFAWGVVLIEHVAVSDGFIGRAFGGPAAQVCTPVARTIQEPHVIAHELGHILGLPHEEDKHNLMYKTQGGYLLAEHQDEILRAGTHWYQDCFEQYYRR